MEFYIKTPMYPGPTALYPKVREALALDYPPARNDQAFQEIYNSCAYGIQKMFGTKNQIVFMSGEAMLGLWSALKNLLQAQDQVLTIGTGYFGDGFADMAQALNCQVSKLSFAYNSTLDEEKLALIEQEIIKTKPKLITVVHCETPSGTLNPLAELGKLKIKHQVPFLVVDAVASLGGTPILADAWHIDICIGGSQKCLSAPPDLTIMSVSEQAFARAKEVNYIGYEALTAFAKIQENIATYPYTPNFSALYALKASIDQLLAEGLDNVYARHEQVAQYCRTELQKMGLELWVEAKAIASPTVTAAYIPKNHTWDSWYQATHKQGLELASSLASLHGKIFRLGHMGVQADMTLMSNALQTIKECLK